jgi:hypothetical protein
MNQQPVRVGFLGCGVVGSAAASILLSDDGDLAARAGRPIELAKVAVQTLSKDRGIALDRGLLTTDPWEVISDPSIDIVVEVMGGIELARDLVIGALKAGKHVVTANKELIANHGQEVLDTAESGRCRRDPDHPADEGIVGWGQRPQGHGHRERHHQLHPHAYVRNGCVVHRSARRSGTARLHGA